MCDQAVKTNLQQTPVHVYSEVKFIDLNWTYFQVSVSRRQALLGNRFSLAQSELVLSKP